MLSLVLQNNNFTKGSQNFHFTPRAVYYEQPLTADELRGLIERLSIAPQDLLRKGEQVYRDLKIAQRDLTDDELIELMIENPDLMQRPIVVRGNRAVLGRPPESVEDLL